MTVFNQEHLLFTPATPESDAIPTIFAFPNKYTIGITSLGYQLVWRTLALRSDVDISRLFTDIYEPLPLSPELFGFSFSWELDYINILNLLESFEISLYSNERNNHQPLVFGGGTVLTANPEPFAAFFDVILLGDGEELLDSFIDAYKEIRTADRQIKLRYLANIPGVYIPSLYEVTYYSLDGGVKSIEPINNDIPNIIQKQTYKSNTLPASTVVTEKAAWENIYMVEVVRSCPEMCRFCLASYLTLPFRTASLEGSLIPAIEKGLTVTNRIGLLGPSITQHPEFEILLDYLSQSKYEDVRLSIASVRTNTVTEKLARTLANRELVRLLLQLKVDQSKLGK